MGPKIFNFDNSYTTLPKYFFVEQKPQSVSAPQLVICNHSLATMLDLDFSHMDDKKLAGLFSGNALPENIKSFCQAYAGHQFGYFTMLGDGRALMLGEHVTFGGDRFDIQFKGSGRTPYSRGGDGRAALGPMLREYIISEAMHHLGIPTSRSLAVVTTGESVVRDKVLQGAMLTRVASSHIRIGTFQFAANQANNNSIRTLLEYTLQRHYPELEMHENKALALLDVVVDRQLDLIIDWMRVGFIHGVMNTDNMTLSGESIDYGPCAFMDTYHPDTVFSAIDQAGRYAYGNQPKIAQWNLMRLAETLIPMIDSDLTKSVDIVAEKVSQFSDSYQQKWLAMMRKKLGLFDEIAGDKKLFDDLFVWMQKNHADFTNTFLDLSQSHKPTGKLYDQASFSDWFERWQSRLRKNKQPISSSRALMHANNPAVIPRNHKVHQALEAAEHGELMPVKELLAVLCEPYTQRDALKPFQQPPLPHEQIHQTFCGT